MTSEKKILKSLLAKCKGIEFQQIASVEYSIQINHVTSKERNIAILSIKDKTQIGLIKGTVVAKIKLTITNNGEGTYDWIQTTFNAKTIKRGSNVSITGFSDDTTMTMLQGYTHGLILPQLGSKTKGYCDCIAFNNDDIKWKNTSIISVESHCICGKTENLITCDKCNKVNYCSEICKLKNVIEHNKVCSILQ